MKWFKQDSNNRHKIEMELIRTRFGAEGYGIYLALKEIIADYVEKDNISEWGYAHPLHDINTLAKECATTPERLKEFLNFCDEKGIFKKKNHRLFDPLIRQQLDNFFDRIQREKGDTTELIRSKSVPTTDKEEKRIEKNRKERISFQRKEINKEKKVFNPPSADSESKGLKLLKQKAKEIGLHAQAGSADILFIILAGIICAFLFFILLNCLHYCAKSADSDYPIKVFQKASGLRPTLGAIMPTITDEICDYFKNNCKVAIAIAKAESHLNCNAVSSTNDHGVFQINIVHERRFKKPMNDCEDNIRVAHDIYLEQGWQPWTVYRTGVYLKYL